MEPSAFNALDTLWVLLAAFLVFFMQAGFSMVEAGMVRAKNAANGTGRQSSFCSPKLGAGIRLGSKTEPTCKNIVFKTFSGPIRQTSQPTITIPAVI